MLIAKRKVWLAAVATLLVLACGGGMLTRQPHGTAGELALPGGQESQAPAPEANPDDGGQPYFRDVATASGVHFTVRNGEEANEYTVLESLGGGVAAIDFDGDGLLDLFFVGGGEFAGADKRTIRGRPCKLYKNLGKHRFKGVTKEVGLDGIGFYSHGVAVCDYDCDGWPDLLVTGYRGLALFHNESDGKGGRRFVNVTRAAGLQALPWSTSAAFGDLDGDGFPDLYICQYLDWSFDNHPTCTFDGKTRDICAPRHFAGLPHKLYRNNRNGTFADVSKQAGLHGSGKAAGKGLGVVVADLDGDGKPDLFVANDTTDNWLYLNRGKGGHVTLEESGLTTGVARNFAGIPTGSKGLAIGDHDGSGRPSVVVTNYENEATTLFRNSRRDAPTAFVDSSHSAGLYLVDLTRVGWGVGFVDFDGDGWLDLFVANGHPLRHPRGKAGRDQRPSLLRNLGNGRFEDVTAKGGVYFQKGHNARGVILADLDNDGALDIVVTHVNQPVVILRPAVPPKHRWLGVELAGKGRRDVVGAKVVVTAGGRKLTHFVSAGGSYLSSGDRRLLFGLGDAKKIDSIAVEWPHGKTQHIDGGGVKLNRYWRVVEGSDAVESGGKE